jgi:hypothetical protein
LFGLAGREAHELPVVLIFLFRYHPGPFDLHDRDFHYE